MKKKWIALLLVAAMVVCAAIPASAAVVRFVPQLSSESLNLKKGDTVQLNAALGTADVTQGMLWTFDTPAVAAVSRGTVTAVGPGAATVTATTGDGRSARCTVRVGVPGIDVSQYQNAVSWTDVKNSGVEFALLRTGYGDELPDVQTDAYFAANYAGAVVAGLKVGVYHHSYATNPDEAVSEANFCLSILGGRSLDYPVFFDVEQDAQAALSADQLSAVAAAFCSTIRSAGYKAGVYSYADLLGSKLTGSVLDPYDKWVAHVGVSEPRYSGAYAVWQYSKEGSVPGITGAVDLDYSYRDYPNPAPQAADISLLSDSPAALTLQKGKTYTYKFTPNGISGTPSFSSGNSGVLKVVSRTLSGGCYYLRVQAVGAGSTAVYSQAPGAAAVRRCVVTVD